MASPPAKPRLLAGLGLALLVLVGCAGDSQAPAGEAAGPVAGVASAEVGTGIGADNDPGANPEPATPAEPGPAPLTADLPPAAEPAAEAAAEPATAPAAQPDTPFVAARRQACAREGGMLQPRGGGLLVCVRSTRDSGQRCTSANDCEGDCLARSGTCAPMTPLYGCHEVLLANGARMTQCLE